MNLPIDLRAFALTAAMAAATAAPAQETPRFETVEVALEATAGAVTLPSSSNGSLVVPPCGGCTPRSFRVTPATGYFIGTQRVTLSELTAAVSSRPETFLTVRYSVETGELTRVTADVAAR